MTALNLSASNRSQIVWKLEGTYPNNFGAAPAGNGKKLNMISETFDFTVKNEESKQIRDDRQVPDTVQVGATSQGGFGFEHQYAEYDPFLEDIVQNQFVAFGTNGASTASGQTLTSSAIDLQVVTATSGADAWTNLAKGDWFTVIPAVGSSQTIKDYFSRRAFRVHPTIAPTTTVLRVDPATPCSAFTLPAGWRVSSAKASNGNTYRSYEIEVQHGDITQYRKYKGMVPSKMDMKLSVGSIVTGTFEFMGKSFDISSTSDMGTPAEPYTFTPANATRGVFDIIENGASISATTYIKTADVSVDNSLRMQDAVGVFGAAGIAAGTMKVSAKLEVYFANATLYRKMLDGVASSLSIPVLDLDGNGYVYHFPRIKYTAAKVGTGGLDQDNMLSVDVQGLPDIDPASPTYRKSIVIYRVGLPVAATGSGSLSGSVATNPRFGYAIALDQTAMDGAAGDTLFAAMTNLDSSVSGGRAGTFSTVSSSTNYTWVAVLASLVSGSGVRFFDGTGYGGFSGAGAVGLYSGSEIDPSIAHLTYTDADGNVWNMYRSDGKAVTYSTFTLS